MEFSFLTKFFLYKRNHFHKNLIFFIIYFLQIKVLFCESCKTSNSLSNKECFNNIYYFNDKKYRAGQFAKNKNGDIVIEYSFEQSRLFFGLKADGTFFFNNDNHIKAIESINSYENIVERYESRNLFVSKETDLEKNNEYLLSISTYKTLTELHNFENNNYLVKKTENFVGNEIYSYQFALLDTKINNKNIYFCIYIHSNDTETEGTLYTIKKFGFTDFNLDSIDNIDSLRLDTNLNNRILSCFIIDEEQLIVIFFIKIEQKLAVSFYDFNLNVKGQNQDINQLNNINLGVGIFFKSLYLENRMVALIFFEDGQAGDSLVFRTYNLYIDDGDYNKIIKIDKTINKYNFQTNITFNDFVKINNKRVAFISTVEFTTLYILIFDLYNNYTSVQIRVYNHQLTNYKVTLEFSAFVYNDYLVFSSTLDEAAGTWNFFSVFMIFGYANDTKSESMIDIYPYFTDTDDHNSDNNIINILFEGLKIDNNIFGYIPAYQIKLISISNEILFYNGEENIPLSNNDIVEFNHRLNQEQNILKNSEDYYSFEYQLVIQEPEYETLFDYAHEVIDFYSSPNFEPKKFFGKKNKVKFKLCHRYCHTCKSLGPSDDDQKCMTCLEDYQYDYFNEYPSNCVPFGYFNDKELKKLVKCDDSNSNYYINTTNNKKICFKNTYKCPDDYPYLNISTHECRNYTPPTTIPTTIFTTIPTTIPTTFITKIPSTIPTTYTTKLYIDSSTIIFTTVPLIKNNDIDEKCNYDKLLNDECSLENVNTTEIYSKLKNELIKSFPSNGESIVVEAEDYAFHLTTNENEINTLNGNLENKHNLSMIDLGECESILRQEYNIPESENLIIFKYEKLTNVPSEKNVQYEVFNPLNLQQLNLSVCEKTPIDIYIPIELSDEREDLYRDLKELGYDLFNEKDSFYTDICSPYKSENGTDVLLSDRKKDFYNNETLCQANCQYSDYSLETEYLKCECSVVPENIDIEEPDKFNGKMIYNSFYDVLKYSNVKVLKCYQLVFNFQILKKNYGSIMAIIFFLIYLIFVFAYIIKGITPIKIYISSLISKKESNKQILNHSRSLKLNNKNYINIDKKIKKEKRKETKREKIKKSKTFKDIIRNKKKSKTTKLKINHNKKEIIKERKKHSTFLFKKISFPPRRQRSNTGKNIIIKNAIFQMNNIKMKESLDNKYTKLDSNSQMIQKSPLINKKSNILETIKNRKSNIFINNNNLENEEKLSNFELNELDYDEAIKLDKRSFMKIYWSILNREHKILFTFFSWNDYNIVYVKFAKFIFLICQDMAMNVLFFNDDSMHKIYANYGKYNFIQQIPQIIYSIIVSQSIEVFLCYLSYTDKHFYQIKMIKNKNSKKSEIFKILKCIKIKLFIFFTYTLILFAFYWYLISAFCAVYQNTQIAFIKDSISSFTTGLFYPFVLYLIPPILRKIAIADAIKKRFNFIYKLSFIIPIF